MKTCWFYYAKELTVKGIEKKSDILLEVLNRLIIPMHRHVNGLIRSTVTIFFYFVLVVIVYA